jgi:hypothetical protein
LALEDTESNSEKVGVRSVDDAALRLLAELRTEMFCLIQCAACVDCRCAFVGAPMFCEESDMQFVEKGVHRFDDLSSAEMPNSVCLDLGYHQLSCYYQVQ